MVATLADRDVEVGRLRVRGGGDELRVRLHVARLLASADVAAERLAPGAILVVRRLDDPLPRGLDPRAASAAPVWERAARSALGDCAARAARPASGPVAATAEAVVFADRAELLAMLAAHWCDGSLHASWWWRTLGVDEPAALLRAFAETPQEVPAALDALARRGGLGAFAGRLAPADAARIARAVGAAFGAGPGVEAALADPSHDAAAARGGPRARAVPAPSGSRAGARAGAAPAPAPWQEHTLGLTELAALSPEAHALAGIAIALRRDPAAVRAPAFAAAARAWRAGLAAGSRAARPVTSARGPVAGGEDATPARAGVSQPPAVSSRPGAAGLPQALRPARAPAPAPSAAAALGRPGGAPDPAAPAVPDASSRRAGLRPSPAATDRDAGERATRADDGPQAPVDGEQRMARAIDTRLGGLLHLVLVGQQLGFYADFASPARTGIRLDVWDFVTLTGARLLGGPRRDPIWALLADLAGRAGGEPAGTGFRPPRSWRVPRSRLAPFAAARGPWRHAERDGRLLLRHPAGFAVLDAHGADLDRELRRYRATHARRIAWPAGDPSPLDRWAGHLAGYVRARLAAALGVGRGRAGALALRRPARILVTDTRVDVVSSLADLPIEVRLACLDRDPGFVPAAGRSLRFHFR